MKRLLFMSTLLATALLCDKYTTAPTETEEYYSNTIVVADIQGNGADAIAVGVDSNGYEWKFLCEDAFIDDVYSCVMYTKNTKNISDDEIVSLRYEGSLSEIDSIELTETGTLVSFKDGTGYYWEK